MRRNKKSNKKINFRTSHKIIFSLLSLIGMLGIVFGSSVFLVLGNGRNTQADTQVAKVTTKKQSDKSRPVADIQVLSSMPVSVANQKEESVQKVEDKSLESSDQVHYTVQAGDTLSHIAAQFEVSVLSIMQQNDLKTAEAIFVGQKLVFLKSYLVKEETAADSEPVVEELSSENQEISIHNGNKVAAGGLSDAERLNVLTQLQTRTGVSAVQWDYIISRESGWIASVKNSIGYYGLFQLAPTYPGYEGDVQAQIEGAIYLFNHGGMAHWAL